jgi:hypothetical protein
MSSTFRLLGLAAILAILAGAFFVVSGDGEEQTKDFPPHSVQQ